MLSDEQRAIRLLETNGEEQYITDFCAELERVRKETAQRCAEICDKTGFVEVAIIMIREEFGL